MNPSYTPHRFYIIGENHKYNVSDLLAGKFPKDVNYYLEIRPKEEQIKDILSIERGFFIPKGDEPYQLNMIRKILPHVVEKLNDLHQVLSHEIFEKISWYLFLISKIIDTNGWKNNFIERKEVIQWNEMLEKGVVYDWKFHLQYGKSEWGMKDISFIIYKEANERTWGRKKEIRIEDKEEIRSGDYIDREWVDKFEPIIWAESKNATPMEQFMCAVHLLIQFMQALDIKKSWTKNDVDYEAGGTDLGVHEEYVTVAIRISNAMSYFVHSTSWLQNDLKEFDVYEMKWKDKFHLSEEYVNALEYKQTL